jgi:N-acyl homoserine lactone hydrolase
MMKINTIQEKNATYRKVLERFKILLPGIPARSNRGWLGYCTVVLFRLHDSWALFDTGHYSDRNELLAALNAVNLKPRDIQYVFLSHLHFDHILNLSLFSDATAIVSKAELNHAEKVVAAVIEDPAIPEVWPALFEGREIQTIEGTTVIDDDLEVAVLPGHTPGGLVLYCRKPAAAAVCGDVIKNGWGLLTGTVTQSATIDSEQQASIQKIIARAEVIIPGHDRPFVIREGGLEYLNDFRWKIQGNIFPRPRDETLLDLSVAEGFYQRCCD